MKPIKFYPYAHKDVIMKKELKDFTISHVNTGCLYEAEGQKITILHGNKTHLFDHSRMIEITIPENNLTDIQAVWKYVKGEYELLDEEVWDLRWEVQKFYRSQIFQDISSQYRMKVIFG